jgi:hypothetical protein
MEIINKKSQLSNNDILIELINNQIKTLPNDKKLLYNDLKRICKYIKTSIFTDECSLWYGYITIIKNDDKKSYINFYYAGKKYALHRLLYLNFKGELNDSEYIKFNCINKGKCCNINHFYKIKKDDIPDHTDLNDDKIYYSPIVINDPDQVTLDQLDLSSEMINKPSSFDSSDSRMLLNNFSKGKIVNDLVINDDKICTTIDKKIDEIIVNFDI